MTNPDLTASLEESLRKVEAGEEPNPNPLAEVDPNSLSTLWERMTDKLALGLPEEITDETLWTAVLRYRAERYRWDQEEENKVRHTRKKKDAPTPVSAQEW